MWQAPLAAWIPRKFRPSVTISWNPCRARSAMTSSSGRSSLFALTVSFQKRVSGRKTAKSSLSVGEKLTSHTQEAPAQRHHQNQRVGGGIADRAVYGIVVLQANSHHAQTPDIDGKHRAARQQAPPQIAQGPPTSRELADRDPTQERQRHICQRRTRRHDHEVSVIVHEANHVAGPVRAKQPPYQ